MMIMTRENLSKGDTENSSSSSLGRKTETDEERK
jgi:hypothetical protein